MRECQQACVRSQQDHDIWCGSTFKQPMDQVTSKNGCAVYLQVLADHKASLATLQAQKKVLDKETAERKEQLARFENDWTKANTDKTAAKKTLQRLQAEQQDT